MRTLESAPRHIVVISAALLADEAIAIGVRLRRELGACCAESANIKITAGVHTNLMGAVYFAFGLYSSCPIQ